MLDPAVIQLAKDKNHAVVTTVMPDGSLQSTVTWVDADDDHVLVNTELDRQRVRNVQRDPRMNVLILGPDYFHLAEVRGKVVEIVRGPEARAHIDALSMKYSGEPYTAPIRTERVILKIAPDRERIV